MPKSTEIDVEAFKQAFDAVLSDPVLALKRELLGQPKLLAEVHSALIAHDTDRYEKRIQRVAEAIEVRIEKGMGDDAAGNLAGALALLKRGDPGANAFLKAYNEGIPFADHLPLFTAPQERDMPEPEAVQVALTRKGNKLREVMARCDLWGDFDIGTALDPGAVEFHRHAALLINMLDALVAEELATQEWDEYTGKLTDHAKKLNDSYTPPDQPYPEELSRELPDQASTATIYKTAILGAGASASYYIANASLDLESTVVIGLADPWAGRRGGEEGAVINHPHHMIDAVQRNARPDFMENEDEHSDGLAERRVFAARVAEIIARVPNQSDAVIHHVRKETYNGATVHLVLTSNGVFFAKEVISALGIGPQRDPFSGYAGRWEGFDQDVRDMDRFMQPEQLQTLADKGSEHVIAVGGGNAGIDVITAIVRNSACKIYWLVGSRGDPQFLDGTDNYIAKQVFDAAPSDRMVVVRQYLPRGGLRKDPDSGTITLSLTKPTRSFQSEEPVIELVVDEVTYGVGADTDSVKAIFAGLRSAQPEAPEVPIDRDQHFHLSLIEKNPDKILDRLGIFTEALRDLLLDPPLDSGAPEVHEALGGVSLLMAPAQPEDFTVIGGQDYREASGPLSDFHQTVVDTLPGNVALGDQLTPSRARVEAVEHTMPLSASGRKLVLETGGINLITANQTVIAAHLASVYPQIPPVLADYLTAQIIVSRTSTVKGWKGKALPRQESEDEGISLEQQRQFQQMWMARLEAFQAALSDLN